MDLLRATFYKQYGSVIQSPKMTELSLLFVNVNNMDDYYSVLQKVYAKVFSYESIEYRNFLYNLCH